MSEIIVRGWDDRALRIVIDARPAIESDEACAEVERVWGELRYGNPRLHDGAVLLVDVERLRRGELACSRGSYRTLATASVLGRAVRALGVCGIVVGRDARGHQHVLFGRRSSATRVYGGMWENAPSGTVAASDGVESIGIGALTAALREEGLEELGIDLGGAEVRAIATVEDARASSVDVVLRVDVREAINPRASPCAAGACGGWEYVDTAWVPVGEVAEWVRRDEEAVSSPTVELVRWMKW